MFVEIHMIQNFAPSCLNRDDTNSPKECEFGGYRRARISSQCLKRAIRTSVEFSASLQGNLAVRTKLLPKTLVDGLVREGKEQEEARVIAEAMVRNLYGGIDDVGKTKVLLFISSKEIDSLKQLIVENWDVLKSLQEVSPRPEKKGGKQNKSSLDLKCVELLKKNPVQQISPDIALFGRMVAEGTSLNIDAASQVAHAISTNKMTVDMDFYTAVDDLQTDNETGAGMMGTIDFTSPCYYRYSVVDVSQLMKNLGGDQAISRISLEAFLKASIAAIPSGKQTSMAAHNPPSLVMIIVRQQGQPLSLANAFVSPVRSNEAQSLIQASIANLDQYAGKVFDAYGKEGVTFIGVLSLENQELPALTKHGATFEKNLGQLLDKATGAVRWAL